MKLKKIKFSNFRLFENLEIEFPDENFIVLIGGNGVGKTTILEGIARCIEHFVGIMTSALPKGHNIDTFLSDLDIKIGKITTSVNSNIDVFDTEFSFQSSKNINLTGSAYEISNEKILQDKRNKIESGEINQYPILGYFSISRSYPMEKISKRNISSPILSEVYDSMMLNISNFSFVNDWFVAASTEESFMRSNEKNYDLELPSLKYVRQAYTKFFSRLDTSFQRVNIQIREGVPYQTDSKSTFFFGLQKNNTLLNFNQLSAGEKSIINIVFAIAQKLIKANSNSENPLNGKGLILIDELDMHLHPAWQVQIVEALKTTFPNIQFIVTTHSPLILSDIRREEIIALTFENGVPIIIPTEILENVYSGTSDEILQKLNFSPIQSLKYINERYELKNLIRQGKYEEASEKLEQLKENNPGRPEWLLEFERRIAFAKA